MDIQAIRQYALSQAPKMELVSTPFWPDLDGYVYIMDVPTGEVGDLQLSLKNQNMKMVGAILCKALVVKDKDNPEAPAQRMFSDTDRETVLQLGTSVITPIGNQMAKLFGMDQTKLDDAIKNA